MAYEYVGIGRTKKFKWGEVVELSFSEKDIGKLMHYLYKGWVRVNVVKRKNADGDVTHYGKIWYPDTVDREEVEQEDNSPELEGIDEERGLNKTVRLSF